MNADSGQNLKKKLVIVLLTQMHAYQQVTGLWNMQPPEDSFKRNSQNTSQGVGFKLKIQLKEQKVPTLVLTIRS